VVGPSVSVVIPVLDAGPSLVERLGSLGAAHDDVGVVLFDNGSSDGAVEAARERFPKACVLRSDVNLGFTVACNRGAGAGRSRYVLFLNSDAWLAHEDLVRLVKIADADEAAAVWQPLIVSPSGEIENAGVFFNRTGFFVRADRVRDDSAPYPAFAATGACMLVRRDVFEQVGGFNDDYFAYIEDIDLCWRVRLAGWEVRVVPSTQVTHEMNVTARRVLDPNVVRYINFRNRIRTLLANASPRMLTLMVPLHVSLCLSTFLVLLVSMRIRSAWAVLRALVWPLMHRKEMREQRVSARALRKRSDADVVGHLRARRSIAQSLELLRRHRKSWAA
jgi:GT2 family glycosyltransferase